MTTDDNIAEIISAAQKAIDEVQASLAESEDFLRGQGIDPQKMRDYATSQLSDKESAQAEADFRADMEAIEQEVAQAKLHQSFQAPSNRSGGLRAPRNMI